MNFYEKMIALLQPLHLYQLNSPNTANAELPVIAEYLETIHEEIDRLFETCFLDQISLANHDQYCELFALSKQLSNATVCEITRRRLSITNRDFTIEGIKKCLRAGGFEVGFSELFGSDMVKITIVSDMGIFHTQAEKEAYIKECLPCHLGVIFVWNDKT